MPIGLHVMGRQRLLVRRLGALLSLLLVAFLWLGRPSAVLAHGVVAGPAGLHHHGHSGLGPGWNLIILAVSILAGLAPVLLFRPQALRHIAAPVRSAFALSLVGLLAAGCFFNQRQQVILPTQTPAATAVQTPTGAPAPGGTEGGGQLPSHDHGPVGHEGAEGQLLGSDQDVESVYPASRCDPAAPVRAYDIAAIRIEITLNRYLDYDPEGRMYVLEETLEQARWEEAQNQAARTGEAEPAVSTGLQGDAIQPLILRVNQGECLRLTLRNALTDDEPASLHLHGSGLYVAATGEPALATKAEAMALPGQSITYEWWVSEAEPEGSHYFHSHGNSRTQTNHGLFGAVIVEPKGSVYLDPLSGEELRSGWAAIIQPPISGAASASFGTSFREFAIIYHEVGTERYRHRNKMGAAVQLIDRLTSAYKPGGRALNYRSEPFMNRLELQWQTFGKSDVSLAYSSYAFGDPATPIARSYLGDPVKQRVIHGGSEVFHVHHVHGGAIRWRRQSGVEPTDFDSGLEKQPALLPQASERLDAQSIGPSESYDLANECGSGGCQQSVGDYLYHCHVAHHYVAGMWGIWRVYNTLQTESAAQDDLPPLQELPDRSGQMEPAVTSQELVSTTVDWQGERFDITADNLAEWVERQLPPPGMPIGYDASVLDWQKEGLLYLNEPETEAIWPGYRAIAPGTRPPIAFDPRTGKLAYPFLRPHLAQRPPFAPNHGPAPFLDPMAQGAPRDPPQPGENGPGSLCPAGTRLQEFVIHAIHLPVSLSERAGIVDPVAQLYVLKEDEEAVRGDNALKTPLAIRANAGEDCVDIIFKNELRDSSENHFFNKASLHIHFVQFDVQGSDGVSTGFNFEQAIRPFTAEGELVQAAVAAGETHLLLVSTARFQPGILVGIGMDEVETFEIGRIQAIEGNTLILEEPLRYAHAPEEIVSTEFLRHRWYPDVQFGTAYFHDHVSALTSWRHGLFGALIAEPPGSTYHSPHTGEAVRSGPVVDVRTEAVVSADIIGSFRELVLFIQDDNSLTRLDDSSGSAINMRVEPLAVRGGEAAGLFSSVLHGDPETPLLEAFLGDPIVIRSLVPATNDVHTLHIDGHWFRLEPYSGLSPPINTIHLGISERADLMIPAAGGPQQLPGDYLYYNGRSFKLREGSWGLIRVYGDTADTGLQPLPGRETVPSPATGETGYAVCPRDAPQKQFDVVAIEVPLPMLDGAVAAGRKGKIYVLVEDQAAVLDGTKEPEPLVLHVNVGDCLLINLSNETQEGPVSFHVDMLAADPQVSLGVEAGLNAGPQSVLPGQTQSYTFYAHPEVGQTVAMVRDWGNVLQNPGLGLYGAIIVGAAGTDYRDPVTGEDMSLRAGWRVDAYAPDGAYRDFTLFLQEEDELIGTAIMPYSEHVAGVVGLNYRAESLLARLNLQPEPVNLFRSDVHGNPVTPLLETFVGDPVRIHVLIPYGEQGHVFTLEGHQWPLEPRRANSDLLSSLQVGPLEAVTLVLPGAGGTAALPGDYLYGDHREPYRQAGLWGIFRVYAPGDNSAEIRPLE